MAVHPVFSFISPFTYSPCATTSLFRVEEKQCVLFVSSQIWVTSEKSQLICAHFGNPEIITFIFDYFWGPLSTGHALATGYSLLTGFQRESAMARDCITLHSAGGTKSDPQPRGSTFTSCDLRFVVNSFCFGWQFAINGPRTMQLLLWVMGIVENNAVWSTMKQCHRLVIVSFYGGQS